MFQLQPDLLLSHGKQRWVLDAKWKRLDSGDRDDKYGLSQGDFYQLFAYGHKYLGGQGDLVLIYPAWQRFKVPLAPFCFDNDNRLRLWVLPFELGAQATHRLLLPEWPAGDGVSGLALPLRTKLMASLVSRA